MVFGKMKAIVFVLLLWAANNVYADLQLQLKVLNEANKNTIETNTYPVYYAYVKAIQGGAAVTLTKDNVILVQDNFTSRPFEVTVPDEQQWQKVSWYAALSEYDRIDVYGFINGDAATVKGRLIDKGMNVLSFSDADYNELFELNMGSVNSGEQSMKMVQMSIARTMKIGEIEQPITIDSIVMAKPFYYKWLGASINQNPPPTKMEPGFMYRFFTYFEPKDSKYYRDKVTVHYNGNSSQTIDLYGNHFDIPTPTLLQIVEPDSSQILAPCMYYEIKWKGYVNGLPTRIDYTTNGGITWQLIAYSFDSTYQWKVPNTPSTKVKVRVTQEFNKNSVYNLNKDYYPIQKLTYNKSGYNILAGGEAGFLREWDIYTQECSEQYTFAAGLNYPYTKATPVGIEYFADDSNFAVASNYSSQKTITKSEIAFFKRGEYTPYNKVQLPAGYNPREMFIDNMKTRLILVPQLGTKILIYDVNTCQLINTIDLKKPISAFNFSKSVNQAVVSFFDGEIQLLNGEDLSVLKSYGFTNMPVIIELALSMNGKYIGLACRAPVGTSSFRSNRTEAHVLDIESGLIVRTNRNTASDALGIDFNTISSSLLIGSELQPQVAVWDLTGDEYIVSLDGHSDAMTDFKVAPDGHSIVTSAVGEDNLMVRFFTYPEHDESAEYLEIGEPTYSVTPITIEPQYISTTNTFKYTGKLCNTGEVPIVLENPYFYSGIHFQMADYKSPDTLMPGICKDISLIFNPKDTGLIKETIGFNTCIGQIEIPISATSLPRNITFYSNPFDFGEKCVGETLRKNILFIRNNDPVPLKINNIYMEKGPYSAFSILTNAIDTVLEPGASLSIDAAFTPNTLLENTDNAILRHSDQTVLIGKTVFRGQGIGTKVQLSHSNLRFIPEIPQRTITAVNPNTNQIAIEGYEFSTPGIYTISDAFPIVLDPADSAEIHITWNGQVTNDITLNLFAKPCVSTIAVTLGQYSADAVITANDVKADPRDRASIPIELSITEPVPYKGSRFVEAELYINPRIFLPDNVTTPYGSATLTRNELIGDRRVMGFRIDGDFPSKGIIGQLEGVAGLAETDTSAIDWNQSSVFLGSTVKVTAQSGLFTLINLCGNRRVIQPESAITISGIRPNPAVGEFDLVFSSQTNAASIVEIYDVIGNRLFGSILSEVKPGINTVRINVSDFKSGNYRIVLKQSSDVSAKNLVIIR